MAWIDQPANAASSAPRRSASRGRKYRLWDRNVPTILAIRVKWEDDMRVFVLVVFVALGLASCVSQEFQAYLAHERGDFATAYRKLKPLADQGDPASQHNLGVMYYEGNGVTKNYAEAERWFRVAAGQGYLSSQHNLGIMYRRGMGVTKDTAEAARWFRMAADQDYAEAQHILGIMYAKGQGVPQDFAQAAGWFRKAADQGDADAQLNLGIMYFNGQGVPKSDIQAHKWLGLAATQGDKRAVAERNLVARRMTPAQIAEAQRLAREWEPRK
jgi:uncharacterized protein